MKLLSQKVSKGGFHRIRVTFTLYGVDFLTSQASDFGLSLTGVFSYFHFNSIHEIKFWKSRKEFSKISTMLWKNLQIHKIAVHKLF